jgi:hypothetical protein
MNKKKLASYLVKIDYFSGISRRPKTSFCHFSKMGSKSKIFSRFFAAFLLQIRKKEFERNWQEVKFL